MPKNEAGNLDKGRVKLLPLKTTLVIIDYNGFGNAFPFLS